jgi:hypothetical protein
LGSARLELERLRLGITPERAKELERVIRVSIAKDSFAEIDTSTYIPLEPVLRAYRLDAAVALEILEANLNYMPSMERNVIMNQLEDHIIKSRIWTSQDERSEFSQFLSSLREQITSPKHTVNKDGSSPSKKQNSQRKK